MALQYVILPCKNYFMDSDDADEDVDSLMGDSMDISSWVFGFEQNIESAFKQATVCFKSSQRLLYI